MEAGVLGNFSDLFPDGKRDVFTRRYMRYTITTAIIKRNIFGTRSRIQGSILVPGLHLRCVFTRKATASSGLKQNLEPNRQLFAKMSIFDEDFRSLMLPLSLTMNL